MWARRRASAVSMKKQKLREKREKRVEGNKNGAEMGEETGRKTVITHISDKSKKMKSPYTYTEQY